MPLMLVKALANLLVAARALVLVFAVAPVLADPPDREDVLGLADTDLDVCLLINPTPFPGAPCRFRRDVNGSGSLDRDTPSVVEQIKDQALGSIALIAQQPRRELSYASELLADGDNRRPVHPQCGGGGAAGGGLSTDPPRGRPAEMVAPCCVAGVKQRYVPPCHRVVCGQAGALSKGTGDTRQGEVSERRPAAGCPWADVIDMESCLLHELRQQAVFADVAGAVANVPVEQNWDAAVTHFITPSGRRRALSFINVSRSASCVRASASRRSRAGSFPSRS